MYGKEDMRLRAVDTRQEIIVDLCVVNCKYRSGFEIFSIERYLEY